MTQRIYTPQGHRFFDNLVTFIAGVASLGTAFEIQSDLASLPYGPNN